MWLVPLYPRHQDYDVLSNTNITLENVKRLSDAADNAWKSLKEKDIKKLGEAIRESFEAQIVMYPHMVSDDILEVLNKYKSSALGWKLSGAGGGGYLIFVSETPIENAIQIRIRKAE